MQDDAPDHDDRACVHAVLQSAYGFVDFETNAIDGGSLNRNYRVDTSEEAYCLKRYNTQLYHSERIAQIYVLVDVIGRRGLPIAPVVPNKIGDLVTSADDAFYVLTRFIEGHHYHRPDIPERAARSMGRTLGQLHLALGSLEAPRPYQAPDATEALLHLQALLIEAERHKHRSTVDQVCCEVLRYKLEALERFPDVPARLASLSTQLTHGDYQETNVLFGRDDEVVGVLDFDNLKRQPRGAEVMRTLWLDFLRADGLLPEAEGFFAGYAAEVLPPETEVALYAPLRMYLSLMGAWPIGDRYEKPEAYQTRWDRFIHPPSDWWEHNLEVVTARLLHLRRACG